MTIDDVAKLYIQDIYNNKDNIGMHRNIGNVSIYFDSDNLIEYMQGKNLNSETYAVIKTADGLAIKYRKEPENFLELAEWMKGDI